MQTLTPEMSKFLSSKISDFKGHYFYAKDQEGNIILRCEDFRSLSTKDLISEFICPAWQVEDVLRNWSEIEKYCVRGQGEVGVGMIALRLYQNSDTVYQKIEEYLWTILK